MYTLLENPQPVTYIWNNLGGLPGETTSYITLKTMVQIPVTKPGIGKIIEVTGKINSVPSYFNFRSLSGYLLVDLKYQCYKNRNNDRINFIIPFRGPAPFTARGFLNSDVKYINARLMGPHNIIIEAAVAITASSDGLREERKVYGEFSKEDSIYIEKGFPKAEEIIGVSIKYNILDCQLQDQQLKVNGLRETAVLYVGEQFSGDKISSIKKIEPFSEGIKLKREISDGGRFIIITKELNTRLINPQELILEGIFSLETIPSTDQNVSWKEMAESLKNLKEFVKKEKTEMKDMQKLEMIKETNEKKGLNQKNAEELQESESVGYSLAMEEYKNNEIEVKEEKQLKDSNKSEKTEDNKYVEIFGNELTEMNVQDIADEKNEEENNKQEVEVGVKEIIPRVSRRERLSKHMRKLKGGLKDKSETKSILYKS